MPWIGWSCKYSARQEAVHSFICGGEGPENSELRHRRFHSQWRTGKEGFALFRRQRRFAGRRYEAGSVHKGIGQEEVDFQYCRTAVSAGSNRRCSMRVSAAIRLSWRRNLDSGPRQTTDLGSGCNRNVEDGTAGKEPVSAPEGVSGNLHWQFQPPAVDDGGQTFSSVRYPRTHLIFPIFRNGGPADPAKPGRSSQVESV